MTKVVALTGSIASGKSTVANLLVEFGATLVDADKIVHELQRPGEAVFSDILERFGGEVLSPAGELDRVALREIILDQESARRDLEAIVHPAVAERRGELVRAAESRGDEIVIVDIPLLFEIGAESEFSTIVLVDAPPAIRRRRLISLRNISSDQTDKLMASQLPSMVKRHRSNYVIDNDGTLAQLRDKVDDLWRWLTE